MTPVQADTLAALKRLTVGGVPPTTRELAKAVGRCDDRVYKTLKALRSQGVLVWEARKPRTLTVIADGVSPVALNALSDMALRQVIANASDILGRRALS